MGNDSKQAAEDVDAITRQDAEAQQKLKQPRPCCTVAHVLQRGTRILNLFTPAKIIPGTTYQAHQVKLYWGIIAGTLLFSPTHGASEVQVIVVVLTLTL